MDGAYLALAASSWRRRESYLEQTRQKRSREKEREVNRSEGEQERSGTRRNCSRALSSEFTNAIPVLSWVEGKKKVLKCFWKEDSDKAVSLSESGNVDGANECPPTVVGLNLGVCSWPRQRRRRLPGTSATGVQISRLSDKYRGAMPCKRLYIRWRTVWPGLYLTGGQGVWPPQEVANHPERSAELLWGSTLTPP